MNDVIDYLVQHIDNDELLGKLVRDLVTFTPAESQTKTRQLTNNINQVARRFVDGSEQEDLTHVHRDPKAALADALRKQSTRKAVLEGQPLLSAPRYTTTQQG
ncbi:hypothetical protein [Furfurilactobacillus siliginis]|uniref:Uncharacterized protein n=1 Tax=Furfurilactobacillus siliginis TaxID=348151 RepID=A0A0R2LDL0_9LACO|nr:hypothetical protein [Furfurilactobacillus siliginis]KRN96340.1 hypothetical protein IV55_GL001302 [Furfurilactobacillus siliginis]GEK29345.1 hypothetical protein LSI01_16560 [Furfurilactobacillus siliginis]